METIASPSHTFYDLPLRPRRNRKSPAIRELLSETHLSPSDLIVPFFVLEGEKQKQAIPTMPELFRLSADLILEELFSLYEKGIRAIALFPAISQDKKCPHGKEASNEKGLIPQTIRYIKKHLPEICLIADVALDPYTTHGHDGWIDEKGDVLNDPTILALCEMSLTLAEAGVDMVAPSDMMDGRVGKIRSYLDQHRFTKTSILAYSAKYASSLYGPFREAVGSKNLLLGDKKGYQLNPANTREALLDALLDEKEGADILLVKPASLYLDVIFSLRAHTHRPIAAYHVSGEYAMVMAAHEKGFLDAPSLFYETLLSIKRAGADLIFTYAYSQVLPLIEEKRI